MPSLRIIAAIAASIVVFLFGITLPGRLLVDQVVFEGQHRSTVSELRHLSDLRNGITYFQVDPQKISEGILKHPWVERAQVSKSLPGTVNIKVEEYTPVALLAFEGELHYVDAKGTVFMKANSSDLNYPVISGVDAALESSHPRLPMAVVQDALWFLNGLAERDVVQPEEVSEVRYVRSRGFTVQLTGATSEQPATSILFGYGNYERQMEHLVQLIERGVDLKAGLHIDVAPPSVALVRPL